MWDLEMWIGVLVVVEGVMVGEIMCFRGQDNCPYDRQSGRNNRRGEVSNDTEAKENRGGDIGTAEQVDNSAGAEWYALSTNDF